jgi:phage tail protein X/phage baseplate assembly protein W
LETLPQTLETVRQAILSPKRVYSELANDLSALKSNISSAWADLTGTLAQYERTANEQLQQAYTAQSFALGLASSDWNGELTAATEELTFLVDAIEAAQSGLDQIAAVEVLAEVLGSSSLPPVNSSSAANSAFVTSGSASATAYSVHQGDTLAGIAARVYGSADLWPAVAERLPDEMQGLSPTQPLDAYVGVGITVPDSVGGTQDLVPYVWETPVGLGCLGRDLPAEFTLQTRSDGTTTLTTLDYQDTLLQGLGQRIALPPGSSADTPEFGSTLFSAIGQNFGVLQRQMTYAFVQEAILSDPRIGSLESLEVFQQQDALAIRFNVRTANNVSLSSDELVVTST